MERLPRHADELSGHCVARLSEHGMDVQTSADPNRRAGVVALHMPDATATASHLRARHIDVMGFPSGLLRIDAAGFNTMDEIDAVVDEIASWIHVGGR